MFKHKSDYFKDILCPELKSSKSCEVINCIFKHDDSKRYLLNGEESEPSAKRQDNGKTKKDVSFLIPLPANIEIVPRQDRNINVKRILAKIKNQNVKSETPNRDALTLEQKLCNSSKTKEDYNNKIDEFVNDSIKPEIEDARFILPKEIKGTSPATIQERKMYIQQILAVYKSYKPDMKTPILQSCEDEYAIASKFTKFSYATQIKRFIFELKKNKGESPHKQRATLSNQELFEKLEELVINKDTLQRYGYVVDVPVGKKPIEERTCARCNKVFNLSDIMKPTVCHYHSGKNRKVEKTIRKWDCCGAIVGELDSDTCETSTHHVIQWSNAEERQYVIPYTHTNDLPTNKNAFKALGIDCEMGFTSKGFELLRTTVLDFFTGEEVLDILVRPKGEVIDLNTKWSGIAEIKEEAVSFENHLALLNEVMDRNTILIGHGLENDLNAMRIIHDRVVDTSILYPKHKTSPTMKYSLKYLCFTYLGRTIQTGEHDSSEDSLGAIDVVKFFLTKPDNRC